MKKFIKDVLCYVLRWHCRVDHTHTDEVNAYGVCSHCNQKLIQDSQGNWF